MNHRRIHPQLPIFAVTDGALQAVYVPGHVMPASERIVTALQTVWRPGSADVPQEELSSTATGLVRAAMAVQSAWARLHAGPFEPVCLNLQLPYACNQACDYCYTRPIPQSAQLNRAAVLAAARLVAGHCARQGVPFQVDIQGLGEPTMRWDDLQWCVEATRAQAQAAGVPWSGHLSTNGQIDPEQAAWIGGTFGHVTISCDGPPEIQDACRPRTDGCPSSARLPQIAAAMAAAAHASLECRVTITGANCARLPEVVEYVARVLGLRSIRLEPVFSPGSAGGTLPDPERMAAACLEACAAGRRLGVEVTLASPSLTELHGEYCQSVRQTLRVLPDGAAVNCLHGACPDRERAVIVGRCAADSVGFTLDSALLGRLRAVAGKVPAACSDCVNIYHCTRCCPDACPNAVSPDASWRCRFQCRLAETWILQAAREAAGPRPRLPSLGASSDMEWQLEEEVQAVPDRAGREAIFADTMRAVRNYDLNESSLPAPAWAIEARCLRDMDATGTLMRESRSRRGPISIYVHLPFCRRRCVFCDCYSVVAGRGAQERFGAYLARVKEDLGVWCEQGGMGCRPVTTVHFGGGTPNAIGEVLLGELVSAIREGTAVHSQTEWAIETTSESSSPEHVDRLAALGFRRLHVGVQTLQDELRRRLGRSSPSATVLERLRTAMARGMVTSVDILYGLPGQAAGHLLADLDRLAAIGVHGVSLYRLNLSERNRGLLRAFPGFQRATLRSCVMLQAAERRLFAAGYRKNHFVHYARPKDTDQYYRHAVRGEDLLGIGASASGAMGHLEYQCALYPDYLNHAENALPIAVLASDPLAPEWARLAARLMAGWVPVHAVPHGEAAGRLMAQWSGGGLLVGELDGWRVTAIGAWLMAKMLCELNIAAQSGLKY